MASHHEQRRPRALLEQLPSQVTAQLAPLFGSHLPVKRGERVDESEFDVLVTTAAVRRSAHLHTLALASDNVGGVRLRVPSLRLMPVSGLPVGSSRPGSPGRPRSPLPLGVDPTAITKSSTKSTEIDVTGFVHLMRDVLARQLSIPRDVEGSLRRLVEETLIPLCATDGPRPRWNAYRWTSTTQEPVELSSGIRPLLTTGKPTEVLAFQGRRADRTGPEGGLLVALPVAPEQLEAWVRWFLQEARQLTPEAFPLDLAWHDDPAWTPLGLRSALDKGAVLALHRREVLAKLDADAREAEHEIKAARDSAKEGWWLLLTEQGERLAAAVKAALEFVGFSVTDSDAGRPQNSPKMEDLRAADPDDPAWAALVEVKGFTRGASPAGATQLMHRPVRAFREQTGTYPDALWYVVNHLIETPPDRRPLALPNDSVVEALSDQGGAVVDSRDLLRAVLDVERGVATPAHVRESMRSARGRWSWPARSS